MERVSQETLYEMTKYRQKSKQAEWLRDNHIPFHFDRYDHPVVFQHDLDKRQPRNAKSQSHPIKSKPKWQPPPLN
ncbi:DUF4224 domain-containing protein [Muribacter muris]|nr:DUF4224 domain-containing protein [Muribacter muris]MBF0786159.1 DUF4224 domain-containing protein [Muribacter muris]MBF0828310.1 DUF4224 domain-containing protein [Muribacter muris]